MYRCVLGLGAAALLMAALSLWTVGCGEEPEASQPARLFRHQVLDQFHRLAQPVSQAAARGDSAALEGLLERICLQEFCEPVHKDFGALVLDSRGHFLAGRYRERARGSGVHEMGADRADYSRYRIASRLKKRLVSQDRMFDSDGPILVVCAPYFQGEDYQACLCFTFPEDTFYQQWGLSPVEFLALNFN